MKDVIGRGRIDYRMTCGTGQALHRHVVARDSDTGVFAYDIIRRGERYGLRIMGSLKPQPSLNVLAIRENRHAVTLVDCPHRAP